MPHLEEPETDVFEQKLPAAGTPLPDGEEPEEVQLDVETPEPDAVEQHVPIATGDLFAPPPDPPLEADVADTAEQSYVVATDEDEYR
jgi:hypothetical protein